MKESLSTSKELSLSDRAAKQLMAQCAATGETPEERLSALLEEMLKDEEKVLAILAQAPREGES